MARWPSARSVLRRDLGPAEGHGAIRLAAPSRRSGSWTEHRQLRVRQIPLIFDADLDEVVAVLLRGIEAKARVAPLVVPNRVDRPAAQIVSSFETQDVQDRREQVDELGWRRLDLERSSGVRPLDHQERVDR